MSLLTKCQQNPSQSLLYKTKKREDAKSDYERMFRRLVNPREHPTSLCSYEQWMTLVQLSGGQSDRNLRSQATGLGPLHLTAEC